MSFRNTNSDWNRVSGLKKFKKSFPAFLVALSFWNFLILVNYWEGYSITKEIHHLFPPQEGPRARLHSVSEFQLPGTADFQTGWDCMWALKKYLEDKAWHSSYFISPQGCCLWAEPIYHCTAVFLCCLSPRSLLPPSLPRLCCGHHNWNYRCVWEMTQQSWLADHLNRHTDSEEGKCLLLYTLSQQSQTNLHAYCCKCRGERLKMFLSSKGLPIKIVCSRGQPCGTEVKFTRSASAAWGSLVWILDVDLHTTCQTMLFQASHI